MTIQGIKNATIGLGLIDKLSNVIVVGGSGIVIHPKGYFLTATHVLDRLEEKRKELESNEKHLKTLKAIISYIPVEGGVFKWITNPVNSWVPFHLRFDKLDADISIGWPDQKEKDHPLLKVSQRQNFSPLEKITMCGYPGGSDTLNPYGTVIDMSFSPAIQEGKITSLFPGDDADTHQGILTNIITTGGSSGSPILDEKEEIIGIAQWVIGGGIDALVKYNDSTYFQTEEKLVEKTIEKKAVVEGYVQVGNTFALSSSVFKDAEKAILQLEEGKTIIKGLEAQTSRPMRIESPLSENS